MLRLHRLWVSQRLLPRISLQWSRSDLVDAVAKRFDGCSMPVIAAVLENLTRMNYLDDARFAKSKALSAAEHKKHGRRRAFVELMKSGVKGDVATKALEEVYDSRDSTSVARELAMKQRARLL